MELCSASDALNIPQVLLKVHDDKLKSVSYKLTQKKREGAELQFVKLAENVSRSDHVVLPLPPLK